MHFRTFLAATAAILTMATVIATPAAAQQTTSGFEGQVTDAAGTALAGAQVTVVDTRTGQSRSVTAGPSGNFLVQNLITGGPYTVTATADGYEGQSVEDVFINLQGKTSFVFNLDASDSSEVIVVSGARANVAQLAIGPGQSFGVGTMEAYPSISRDVRDIIRIDPRVSLDRSDEVDRISCLGGNDRANTFTVDGIVQADSFGLNGTPFAARSALPIPFDSIRETSVEFAPFDVEYGQFTGCAVNVVTKSGTNEFHGSAFVTFRNEDMRGSKLEGDSFTVAPFEEKRWGATLGGPIIKDRLFFFGAYEETDLGDINGFGPAGGGYPDEAEFASQADFDRFAQIAQDVYGQDVGGYPRSLPQSSVRYFGRIDALITDTQRLELTYQRLEEADVQSDTGSNELAGLNSFSNYGTESDYYSGRLFSEWTDNFSTELRYSHSKVADVQGPVGFGEAQSDNPTVRLAVGVVGPTQNGILTTGPSIFRSANALNQTIDQFKAKANLTLGDHELTFGAELNRLKAYNLFAINATGTIYFQTLDDFENGLVAPAVYSSAFSSANDLANGVLGGATIAATGSGDINEAAATFVRSIYSAYAQDSWQASDRLNLLIGARVDWYDGDTPRANPLFQQRYGFSNAVPFSRFDPLFLPRVGFTYDLDNDGFVRSTVLKGGIGLFGGGDPSVWFSNAFSNNGFSSANGDTTAAGCAGLLDGNGQFSVLDGSGAFTGIPACAIAAASASAAVGGAPVQSTDPDLKLPSVFRANLGLATEFGAGTGFFGNWRMNVDYIYSRYRNPLNWVDLTYAIDYRQNGGYTADGRPIYSSIDPLIAGCGASYTGTPGVWNGVTDVCFATGREDEIQLTNSGGFDAHTASLVFSKNFPQGIFTDGGNVSINLGYAFTDADGIRDARSSTATSNFGKSAYFDALSPDVATSGYETRHNITFAMNVREEFFGDYGTEVGLFFQARSGRPYSLTFDGSPFNELSSSRDSSLLYVPTGIDDLNVSPTSDPAAVQSLIDYVAGTNCKYTPGATIKANTCHADWVFDLDMRIAQEVPGPGNFFGVDDRITLFADFDNFLNLLNSDWNVFNTVPGGTYAGGDGLLVDVADGGYDANGRYVISGFNPDDSANRVTSASIWKIQVGARYEF